MSDEFELDLEGDRATALRMGGYTGPVLRVRYRRKGERVWTRFTMIPREGQSLSELAEGAEAAAREHLRRRGR